MHINWFLQQFYALRKVALQREIAQIFSGYWKPEPNLTVYHILKKKPVETLVSEKYFLHGFFVDVL